MIHRRIESLSSGQSRSSIFGKPVIHDTLKSGWIVSFLVLVSFSVPAAAAALEGRIMGLRAFGLAREALRALLCLLWGMRLRLFYPFWFRFFCLSVIGAVVVWQRKQHVQMGGSLGEGRCH
ncbi:uncharacterized protein EI97DRAFT_184135 [Westerdykella ornata]|uniref:Uncharacterized protein n=1 Tax=Westerdykella ornata TaxID=318751 RepID=A0A6A6JUB0_WESOR|nr:uncharacterized protein EI97DRAFT_184135 [Westerdykella ornata]KAF2279693.1 hypothetical protein EI97DRAFT_184135 [Westerdykella ornata]